jgi:hypothetical protein
MFHVMDAAAVFAALLLAALSPAACGAAFADPVLFPLIEASGSGGAL